MTEDTFVVIIRQLAPNSYIIKCPFCDGQGLAPEQMTYAGNNEYAQKVSRWSKTNACKVCDGKGLIRIESEDVPVKCGVCRGTGHAAEVITNSYRFGSSNDVSSYICPKCQGTGARSLSGILKIVK